MYGIDFGTTYTVVSYNQDGNVKFLSIDDSYLFPTKVDGYSNLKRLILENAANLKQSSLYDVVVSFFKVINQKIQDELGDDQEYKNCVLTVPVRFNDLARNFIKSCAMSAGFNIVKLLQEPVAAAISSLENKKNGHYLVYDLGGGTFDCTLLNFQDDVFQVISVDGIPNFGGVDIDEFISKKYKISLKDAILKKETEYIKDLDELLLPTYEIIESISKKYDINALILAGGSSYLKNIYNHFKKSFDVILNENLQLIVSKGACIYGNDFLKESQFLIDVTPFNLGIESLGDKMEVIIPQNSPIPTVSKEIFHPINEKVTINILQGNHDKASECSKIHSFTVNATKPFEVSFFLDYDGILSVKVLNETWMFDNVFKT